MIHIKKMELCHVSQVCCIEKSIFSIPWSEKSFINSLENENTTYIVALDEDEVVGYCGMYISFTDGNITNVAVSNPYRRKHIGEQLLNSIISIGKERGVENITLEVRETNVKAISLYEKNGFEEAGIRKDFYEKPKENAIIMWKHNL